MASHGQCYLFSCLSRVSYFYTIICSVVLAIGVRRMARYAGVEVIEAGQDRTPSDGWVRSEAAATNQNASLSPTSPSIDVMADESSNKVDPLRYYFCFLRGHRRADK
jgi:hypothetical protein